ncbi:hypothetical protein FZZ91_01255 [Synechococcus sp. HB1133]|uniref:hypothetical protein n=1 Tax=unclassified Synechococcus TaxID=2626047 RepID=UPI00140DBBAD|nr:MULTISPECIES: hypothetical protein [unclassified Synechococcus]MCB4421464.1 hypothetical protein [Synechococcus sp. HB1133]MCB4431185.1 hypothetical protein [Synechococcus sp. HBA1120]NHI80406.1 hypothetical protein [Synechococcus sp. HB1133]
MKNKNRAVVTGGDWKLLNPAGVFFTSMKNNSPGLYENSVKYYFLYGDTQGSQESLEALRKMGIIVKSINNMATDMPEIGHFTRGLISKFIPFMMQQSKLFEASIWFDVDQIVIKDMEETINEAEKRDASFIKGGGTVYNQFKSENIGKYKEYRDIDFNLEGICGSFFVINKCPKNSFSILKELYANLGDNLYLGEQGVLDIFIQRNYLHRDAVWMDGGEYTPHPDSWSVEKLKKSTQTDWPYLLHSYGARKFWTVEEPHLLWKSYNEQWNNFKSGGKH